MFNITEPLSLRDWLVLIPATFPVFLIGDLLRVRKGK
jgi:hypothetical protein